METLIDKLIKEGYLKTSLIIEAFRNVRREDFVLEELKEEADINAPLSIGYGQTISQPLTVAFMLELLEPRLGDKVLDIGAGSGWQTALLAHLGGKEGRVVAVERIIALKELAEANLSQYGNLQRRIRVIGGDGSQGVGEEAPFDRIIAGAAAHDIPGAWLSQLRIGGILVG